MIYAQNQDHSVNTDVNTATGGHADIPIVNVDEPILDIEEHLDVIIIIILIAIVSIIMFIIAINLRKSLVLWKIRYNRFLGYSADRASESSHQQVDAYSMPPPVYSIAVDMPKPSASSIDSYVCSRELTRRQSIDAVPNASCVSMQLTTAHPPKRLPKERVKQSQKKRGQRNSSGVTMVITRSSSTVSVQTTQSVKSGDSRLSLQATNLPSYSEALTMLETQNTAVVTL